LKALDCLVGVVGKSVSHHHNCSAWQRTEWRWVYGDSGVTEIDGVAGSIYSTDPGVDRLSPELVSHLITSCISNHVIIQPITHCSNPIFWSDLLCARLGGSSRLGSVISSLPLPTLLVPELLFATNWFWFTARGVAAWWWWALCHLTPWFDHMGIVCRCTLVDEGITCHLLLFLNVVRQWIPCQRRW